MMKKTFPLTILVLMSIIIILYPFKNGYARRIKTFNSFNELTNAQIIFVGEYHSDLSCKEKIISQLNQLKELGVNCLAIELFPAIHQSLLDEYFLNPTQELTDKIWNILYKKIFLTYNTSGCFLIRDELAEIEEDLKTDMEMGHYDAQIKAMANSYLNLIKAAVKKGIKIIGIGVTLYQNIGREEYEKFMARKIITNFSKGKILVLVGKGHLNPPNIPNIGNIWNYGYLPTILDKQGYKTTIYPINEQ